jgi:hypothetical protein
MPHLWGDEKNILGKDGVADDIQNSIVRITTRDWLTSSMMFGLVFMNSIWKSGCPL